MHKSDKKYFERLSEKTRFQRDVLEKVFRLSDLLYMIYENEFLGRRLAIKGGTAINFIYFKMPRLSVDIDFNFVSDGNREDMLKARENINKILTKILRMEGYEIEKVQPYALLQYNLKYINTAGNADRIKIEINFMERVPVFEIIEKKIMILEKPEFKVRTYMLEELFATKLRALFMRAAARDLFDVYMLLESGLEFDKTMLKKCFIFYFCLADDFRKISTERISKIDQNDIKKFLLPLMEKGTKIDINNAGEKIKAFASELIVLNKNEQKFIRLFYEEKKAVLDLLFEDVKCNPRLGNHPMLKWKLRNM
ncbi:MAG: nucleotidyl transferase AbiEii/AbiGii toxin family protein [Nanoarchaeota archaeon]